MTPFEARVYELWRQWSPVLLLEHHSLTVRPMPEHDKGYMRSALRYPYLDARIEYGPEAVRDWEGDRQRETEAAVVHEFCHFLTDPLYCKATSRYVSKDEIEDERERLTDHIQRIVLQRGLP